MATQRYSVALHVIKALPAWVRSGEIAIPEQRRVRMGQKIQTCFGVL